jgi:uncharacterized protein (DUF305 family)
MSKTRILGFILSATAAISLLAACSGGNDNHASMSSMSTSPAASAGAHNTADTTFAQQMIPHHQQAVEMAKLVPSRTKNPKVIALAQQIQQAQAPEIQLMTGWLGQWGAAAPMAGMSGMPGMMSDADMTSLGKATDAAFDKQWLQMMISHHQGAIDMANTELKQGTSPEAKQLAQRIITAQQAEITTMNTLLA